jgi:hypothetical protein
MVMKILSSSVAPTSKTKLASMLLILVLDIIANSFIELSVSPNLDSFDIIAGTSLVG